MEMCTQKRIKAKIVPGGCISLIRPKLFTDAAMV